MTRCPPRSASARHTSAANAADPDTHSRSAASSPTRSLAARRTYIVGTPKKRVARSSAARSSTPSTLNGAIAMLAPVSKVPCTPTPRPCMWNSGRVSTNRSSGVQRHATCTPCALAERVAVTEDRSLRPAGRPRGEHQHRGIVGDARVERAGSPGIEAFERRWHTRDAGEPRRIVQHGELRARLAPHVAQLVRTERGVHRNDDRAEP